MEEIQGSLLANGSSLYLLSVQSEAYGVQTVLLIGLLDFSIEVLLLLRREYCVYLSSGIENSD